MTRAELRAWARARAPRELPELVGFRAFVAEVDASGRLARQEWLVALHRGMERVVETLGGSGPSRLGGEDAEAYGELLDQRILPALEEVGLVRRDPSGGTWTAAMLDDGLVDSLRHTAGDGRSALLAELDEAVEALEARRTDFGASGDAPAEPSPGLSPSPRVVAPDEGRRLRGEGLTKSFRRRTVVNEVDIEVNQGEIVGLLGPNGAGKTTTFYMVVGLIPPNAGKVYLDGEDLTKVPMYKRARKGVGYLAQEPSVFRKLSVEENVLAILETLNLPRAEERKRLEELLGELGLQGLRDAKAYALSGGERRRLEITRALVQQPSFMLLDEPFAGIDPIAVNDIQHIVRGLKSRNIGVIISDHNVEQTLEIVDRAYIMYEGRIRVSGSVSELVWNDEVAEIYLGPTLTARMRERYPRPEAPSGSGAGEGVLHQPAGTSPGGDG